MIPDTLEDALIELIWRVGVLHDKPAELSVAELEQWPVEAVSALQSQKLILRTRNATSATCWECDEGECTSRVHTLDSARFILCDKRDDTHHVPVSEKQLTQWRCDSDTLAQWIADCLSIRCKKNYLDGKNLLEIGMAKGNKQNQMLCLKLEEELALVAGDAAPIPLEELIRFEVGAFGLDQKMILRMIDSSTTSDSSYTSSTVRREAGKLNTEERYEAWRKEQRRFMKEKPNATVSWCAKQIAEMEIGKDHEPEAIRRKLIPKSKL